MDRNETLGNTAMYGGSLTTACVAQASFFTESHVLMVFSAIGALCALCGLIYTVWNGNRNFKLQQEALRLNLLSRGLQIQETIDG